MHLSIDPLGSQYQKHQDFTKITTIPPATVKWSLNAFSLFHSEPVKHSVKTAGIPN